MKTKFNHSMRNGIIFLFISLFFTNCQTEEISLLQSEVSQAKAWFEKNHNSQLEKNKFYLDIIDWENAVFKDENIYIPIISSYDENFVLNTNDNLFTNFHARPYLLLEKDTKNTYIEKLIVFFGTIDYTDIFKLNFRKYNTKNQILEDSFENQNQQFLKSGSCETYYLVRVRTYSDGSYDTEIIGTQQICDPGKDDGGSGGGGLRIIVVEEEEIKIINDLEGRAKCVYEKMVDSNNNINWILENFEDGDKPSQFSLQFEMSSTLDNLTNASFATPQQSGVPNTFVIKINSNTLPQRTSLGIARTILHEGIHARLWEFAYRNGKTVDPNDFPGVYEYMRTHEKNWDHQQMADYYRNTIAQGLKQFDNSQHSDSYYDALAWEGLAEIKDANNDYELIYTEAWKKLSTSEQQEILQIITNEKQNGSKECND